MGALEQLRSRLPQMRYNLAELRQLASEVSSGGLLVEIGSFAGESTEVFLAAGLRVHAIDPWDNASRDKLNAGAPDFDPARQWPFEMAEVEGLFDRLLSQFPATLTKRKGYDASFVEAYCSQSVDAVYIDSIHTYEETTEAIRRWLPKVREGGVIAGHDYGVYFPDVTRAVQDLFGMPTHVFADTSWLVRVEHS